MKKKLLLIVTLISLTSYTQDSCLFDEIKFSGTVTTTSVGGVKFKATDATSNHRFGERVAIDGNIAVTVSRSNGEAAGKVYVYTKDDSGNWTQQTILTASDGFAGDNFGSSIALQGNYLVVGASSQTNSSAVDTGAAYLFEYDGSSTWTEVAIFEPSDGSSGDRFGVSASIEGNLILIGARDGSVGGCAYLYEKNGTGTFTYTETKLEPQVQSGYSGARFGYDVLIKDGRAYVSGLRDYSEVGNAFAGSVQIWDQANDGTWSRTHRLRGTESSESFGSSISVEGDYLAIGAYNYEVSSTPEADQGRVYVYKADSNGDYLETNRVMIQNNDKDSYNDQRFGADVVIENGFLYVGTYGNGSSNTDALYIFKDDGTNNWSQLSKITSGGGWNEFSNRAVAVSFPNLLIGQNEDDSPSNSGAIHFVSLASTITPTASVSEVTQAYIGQNNAAMKLNFTDEASRTEIQFSIDGGLTFPYTFSDDTLTGEITNLGVGSYHLKARYNSGSCILDLGTVSVNQATYTAIPDAKFEAALEALGYDDISGDGQVPTSLIENITILNISNKGIADLTGIEDFLALEELKANGNDLSTINLTNNTALKILWIRQGNNNFSSIDVSKNIALEDFRIQYSGTSLDISNNTALTQFMCVDCGLTSLNMNANTNLNSLDLEGSNITALDLSANSNLTGLEINNTKLISLNLSNNTLLEYVYAKNIATLTSLNIQSGANTLIKAFETAGTPVSCILVDDVTYSTTNWTNIDPASSFNEEYCEYTAIPDANFEAALEALGYDNISNDGQVPTALIENITELIVNSKNITDLTGIQDFKNLETLKCEANTLTALDVTKNLALKELKAKDNNITSIDLSQNGELLIVDLGANPLTALDVSNNSKITRLECPFSDITAINVSNLSQLDYLELFDTDISSLDLSNNLLLRIAILYKTNITSLDISLNTALKELRVDNTRLTSLDVSSNTLIESLRVNGSDITELDLTKLTALTEFYGQTGVLEKINLKNGNNTNITNFDVRNNDNLNCILVDNASYSTTNWTNINGTTSFTDTYCEYTAIPDSDFEAALYNLGYDDIVNDGQVPTALIEVVTSLSINNKNIADLTGIEDFTALTDLNVDTNDLTNLDVSANANLQNLNFDNNSINTLNLGSISKLESIEGRYNQLSTIDLTQSPNLNFINLRNNLFTTVNVSNNPLLETINLRACTNLTSINISNNTNVKYLYFQDTPLTELDVSNNSLLEVIVIERVNFNSIDVSHLSALTQLRIADNSFTTLDVSNNPALVRLECENNNLTYLNIKNGNNTNMPNADFKATGNSSLTCIIVDDATYSATNWTNIDVTTTFTDANYCNYTVIPDANFEAALEALGYDDISGDGQVPTPLIEVVEDLTIVSKSITDITGIEDFKALKTLNCAGNTFTSLDLSNNTELTSVITKFTPITTLNISNSPNLDMLVCSFNNLSALDVSKNTALTYLECNNNNLTSLDVSLNTALSDLRCGSNSLTAIDVTNNTALTSFWCQDNAITDLDLSNQAELVSITVNKNSLVSLNVKNGNNMNVTNFIATSNVSLTCINVDDVTYSSTNWLGIDNTANFSNTGCSYTQIPDANFEAELEALGYDDISGDGQVPTYLIEVVTSLALPNKGISDLTGIEDFVALTSLNCRVNNLTTLDVTKNTLLKTLTADSNSITSIDLSNNTDLEILNLAGSNLTSLDITNNPSLRKLFVNGNSGLTSLNISNNTRLVEFRAYATNITALDFSVHTDLESLECYNTQLSSIDVSNNPELRVLRVDNTNITELNLSNNPNIGTLRVNDTGIQSLDLTNQTALQTLYANDTNLSYLNIKNGNNTNITTFRAEDNLNLTCILVDDVTYSTNNWTDIDGTTSFTNNYCRYTTILDANFEAALESLGYDDISGDGQVPTALIEGITTLEVNNLSITDFTGIEDFTRLTYLDVGNNNAGSIDITNLVLLEFVRLDAMSLTSIDLSKNTALVDLRCSFNSGITSIDVSNNTLLETVHIGNNSLTSIDLSNNKLLYELRMSNNNLTSVDLSSNTALTELNLSNNELSYLNLKNANNTSILIFYSTGNPLLSCVLVDDANYSTTNWTNIDNTTSFSDTNCLGVQIAIKVYLQGAFINPNTGEESLMRDDLRVAGGIYNSTSPYSDGVTISDAIKLDDAGSNSMVDWVWVELRDANDSSIIIAEKTGVLQRDGDIVDTTENRVTPLSFDVPSDNYYIVIRHRNHLGIMTASPTSLSSSLTTLDLSSNSNLITGGINAMINMGNGIYAIPSGDFDENGQVQNIDTNSVIQLLGVSGYNKADLDMNGQVQNSDINNLLNPNIGKGEQF